MKIRALKNTSVGRYTYSPTTILTVDYNYGRYLIETGFAERVPENMRSANEGYTPEVPDIDGGGASPKRRRGRPPKSSVSNI